MVKMGSGEVRVTEARWTGAGAPGAQVRARFRVDREDPQEALPWMSKHLPWKPERGRETSHRSSTYLILSL